VIVKQALVFLTRALQQYAFSYFNTTAERSKELVQNGESAIGLLIPKIDLNSVGIIFTARDPKKIFNGVFF